MTALDAAQTEALMRYGEGAEFRIDDGKPRILLACIPKTGSTFLSTIFARLPGMRRAYLHDGIGHDLSARMLIQNMHDAYVAQHHVRWSKLTEGFVFRFGLMPVLQVRNMLDICVSLRDMKVARGPEGSAELAAFCEWDDEKRYDYIIECIAPTYLELYNTWAMRPVPTISVSYEDLVQDTFGTVLGVCRRLQLPFDGDEITGAIRLAQQDPTKKNVAVVGRGREQLTSRQIERLRRLAAYFPYIDHGPLGL